MDFCLEYTKRIIGSVLLAGVVSLSVMSSASCDAADLGNLSSKEEKTGSDDILEEESSDDLEGTDARGKNEAFSDNINGDKSLSTTEDSLTNEESPDSIDANSSSGDSPHTDSGITGSQTKDSDMLVGDSSLGNNGKNPSDMGTSNKLSYQKNIVNALRKLDPKYTVPIVLFPALFGGLGGALKSYLQNRKAKDDFDTVEDHDTTKNDENNNEIIKHKENSSNAIYWKIILGIVGLVLIVLLFSYRKQLPIIVLGLDRWARIKGWDEKDKKYFYRLYFGHKKYKSQFPNDWWKLYIEDKDSGEFISDLETEGDFDKVIAEFLNAHKSYNGDLHCIVSKNFSLLIKRYIEAFGYEKYKSRFSKKWWKKNFGNCECGNLYYDYANLDPYSKEFEEVFFELMKNRFNKDKAVKRRVGLMEDTLFQILKKYPSTAYCALIMPEACEWKLSENKDKLLVKIGDKFINFEIIVYLALSAQGKYKDLIVSPKKFDEAQKEGLQFEKKFSKDGREIKFNHRGGNFEPIIDEKTEKILDLGKMFMNSPIAVKFQEIESSTRMPEFLGAMLEIPEFVTF